MSNRRIDAVAPEGCRATVETLAAHFPPSSLRPSERKSVLEAAFEMRRRTLQELRKWHSSTLRLIQKLDERESQAAVNAGVREAHRAAIAEIDRLLG